MDDGLDKQPQIQLKPDDHLLMASSVLRAEKICKTYSKH